MSDSEEKYSGDNYRGAGHASPYPVSRLGAPVSLVDMASGERVLSFVEMDQNRKPGFDGRYAFIVRPIEPMEMGHRHAVIVRRGLLAADGTEIPRTDAFEAIATGQRTDSDEVEAIRKRTETVLDFAELTFERGARAGHLRTPETESCQ